MRHDPTARLEARFDSHELRGRLHDVPPHEVYEVTVDGQRAVYKGNTGPTGRAGTEGRVLSFVGEHTSTPVPETLLVGDEFYVAAWHDDAPAPGTGRSADVDWARAAGRGLASLHGETAPLLDTYGAVPPGDRAESDSHDEWHAAAVADVRDRRPVLARYGHGDVAGTVLEYLDGHPDAFAGAGGPVCCHGWATPEHVSVVDGEVACMVDFEHAIAAPGEYDVWRTVVPAFGSEESDARTAFREGYESVRPLPDGFERRRPYYALLNMVYYFQSLYVQDQHEPSETAAMAERLRTRVTELVDRLV